MHNWISSIISYLCKGLLLENIRRLFICNSTFAIGTTSLLLSLTTVKILNILIGLLAQLIKNSTHFYLALLPWIFKTTGQWKYRRFFSWTDAYSSIDNGLHLTSSFLQARYTSTFDMNLYYCTTFCTLVHSSTIQLWTINSFWYNIS